MRRNSEPWSIVSEGAKKKEKLINLNEEQFLLYIISGDLHHTFLTNHNRT